MANPAHVEILEKEVAVWNEWRHESRYTIQDLSNLDLSSKFWVDLPGIDLSGANLTGADLSRVNLVGANLRHADLPEAHLPKVLLSQAELHFADLRKTYLAGAHLDGAHLGHACLAGADLTIALFGETILSATDLSGVVGLETCHHTAPSGLDHRTLIRSGRLPQAFLRGCGLPDAFIENIPALFWEKPLEFYSCFISYSHADKAFATKVYDILQERGIRCWLDEKQMLPGDDIYDQVDRGLRVSDKVLLCCSQNSLKNSWWVDNEIVIVLAKEQEVFKKRQQKILALIPLDLDGYLFTDGWTSGYREQIRRRLAADFKGWETDEGKFQSQMERVVQALRTDKETRTSRRS